jgi:hypothetical protein
MDGAEQLSGVQSEDLIGMIRYAEKSRMSATLFKSFRYVSSLGPLYQFTVKYMSVFRSCYRYPSSQSSSGSCA